VQHNNNWAETLTAPWSNYLSTVSSASTLISTAELQQLSRCRIASAALTAAGGLVSFMYHRDCVAGWSGPVQWLHALSGWVDSIVCVVWLYIRRFSVVTRTRLLYYMVFSLHIVVECHFRFRISAESRWSLSVYFRFRPKLKISLSVGLYWYQKHLRAVTISLPSNRQHLSSDACLEDKREDNQNCSVLCCVWQSCAMIRTCTWAVLTLLHVRFRFLYVDLCFFPLCVLSC